MLKLQFRDNRKPAIWLVDNRYAIGRDLSSDIVVEDEGVGALHAELRVEPDDKVFLSDAGSLKGTFVNGVQVKGRTQLKVGDVIRIHTVELELIDPKDQLRAASVDSATAISPALQGLGISNRVAASEAVAGGQEGWLLRGRTGTVFGEAFPIPAEGRAVLGRAPSCDIVLPGNHVSRQHAELFFNQGRLHVKDLGSANGTYVNRKRVNEAVVNPGDEIRFDTLVFEVESTRAQTLTATDGDEATRFQPALKAAEASESSPLSEPAVTPAAPAAATPAAVTTPPATAREAVKAAPVSDATKTSVPSSQGKSRTPLIAASVAAVLLLVVLYWVLV